MIRKVFLILIVSIMCHAKYVEGEANFLSERGDSLSFIKKQLLSNAFKKVINVEIKDMGLDSVTFWTNYNAKFEEYFLAIKNSVEQKYIDSETQIIPENKLEKVRHQIRKKRLIAKSKFGRLSRAIKSYSIKKLSKSVTMANSHYVNVNAQVNRKTLTDIYYKFIGISSVRTFRKVYLDIDYKITNGSWLDLGVESEKDFVDVVSGHWVNKLNLSLREIFTDGIVLVNDSDRSRIKDRMRKSEVVLSAIDSTMMDEDELELSNSLYLKIEIEITKNQKFNEANKISLDFSGGIIITDLIDNSIVTFQDFIKENSVFNNVETHKLSSNIASLVYRLPMPQIQKMRKIVEEKIKSRKSFEILIKGTRSTDEVYTFIELMNKKGLLYYFSARLVRIVNDEAHLIVKYSGKKEKALLVLNKMLKLKISDLREIEKAGELPYVFNIKSLTPVMKINKVEV